MTTTQTDTEHLIAAVRRAAAPAALLKAQHTGSNLRSRTLAPAGSIEALTSLAEHYGYTVSFGTTSHQGEADGVTNYLDRTITLTQKLNPKSVSTLDVLAHEVAHAVRLRLTPRIADFAYAGSGRKEIEAESVAELVLSSLGIDRTRSHAGYLVNWAQQLDAPQFMEMLGMGITPDPDAVASVVNSDIVTRIANIEREAIADPRSIKRLAKGRHWDVSRYA
jgi:hypothetical protein